VTSVGQVVCSLWHRDKGCWTRAGFVVKHGFRAVFPACRHGMRQVPSRLLELLSVANRLLADIGCLLLLCAQACRMHA
jgi:hypothetical protein